MNQVDNLLYTLHITNHGILLAVACRLEVNLEISHEFTI